MRYISALLAAVLIAGLSAGTANADESPSGSGIGIRLADAPATDDPRARSYIVEHMAPGAEIKRMVEVSNTSDESRTVKVYPGAADIKGGVFTVADEGKDNDLSGWTTAAESTITMAPGATKTIPVTISVPDDAAEGERYGAIWAQVQATEGNSVQVSRVGVRQYISVGAGSGPATDFTVTNLTAELNGDGARIVTADVANTGGRALDVTGKLSLAGGPGGITAGPLSLDSTVTVAPGANAKVTVAVDDELPSGNWDAALALTSGKITHEVTADLTLPAAGTDTAEPAGDRSFSFIAMAALLLVLAAVVVAAVLAGRRKKRPTGRRSAK